MLFQEFTFEVIVKPRKSNVGSDHLCRLEWGELGWSIDYEFPDAHMFRIEVFPEYL